MDNKSVILPKWIDKIIFDDFEAVYEPCPMEVVYNPDQPYEFVKLYLGTYFPRSFAEAYSIISSLMTNDKYKQSLYNLQEINVLDFCCGTGGEIVGLLVALSDNLPNLKRVNINAYDANPDAILFLYHLTELMEKAPEFRLEIHINPQCIYIESELEIQDVINMSNVQYHFIMSFKAINEFVQRGTFNKSNPYELIVSYFSPLLKANGVFIISDVTTKVDNGLYYPQMMNSGINRFLKNSQQYKSIVPNACYHLENQCSGCYMQDIFHVSHRGKNSDRSKIAYRIICNKSFAQEVMAGYTLKTCRAINPLADKNIKGMQEALDKLLELKLAKRAAKDTLLHFDFYLQPQVLMYAKIAAIHGFDLGIDSPIAPKELIDINPLAEYKIPYDFMKSFDFDAPHQVWVNYIKQRMEEAKQKKVENKKGFWASLFGR